MNAKFWLKNLLAANYLEELVTEGRIVVKIRDHGLYLLSVRKQLLEHCTLNCKLLHVLAFWPSSGRFYNIRRREYRGEGLDLDFLSHVCCRKVHLVLDK